METYHETFIKNVSSRIDFEGKRVLEIGCGDGSALKTIAKNFCPDYIIGIDNGLDDWWATAPSKGDNWEVAEGNAEKLEFPDNYFDAVLSLATFEHITDVGQALKEIKRVLKPFGKFYTEFSPIWTSIIGHHYNFWIDKENAQLIPPWGHLWMSEDEMKEHLLVKLGFENAQAVCDTIYHHPIINRLTRSQHYELIMHSGLLVKELREHICLSRAAQFGEKSSEMTPEILKRLIGLYEPYELATSGFSFFLEKYANI